MSFPPTAVSSHVKKTIPIVSGTQRQVQDAIDQLVETGAERGIQVAAYRGGELVVDAVAGIADPATGRLVTSSTPFYNFSIGKGAASTIAHMLVDRGLLGYDTPVVDLWPEFGAHGKLRLDHRTGIPNEIRLHGVPGLYSGTLDGWTSRIAGPLKPPRSRPQSRLNEPPVAGSSNHLSGSRNGSGRGCGGWGSARGRFAPHTSPNYGARKATRRSAPHSWKRSSSFGRMCSSTAAMSSSSTS